MPKGRIKMTEDHSIKDILHLEKKYLDPNYHYRFLRNVEQNINIKRFAGHYEIDHEYNRKLKKGTQESEYKVGDLILAKRPKEIQENAKKSHERKLKEIEQSYEARLDKDIEIKEEEIRGQKSII